MRRIGSSDLLVSPLCLGGNVFGWTLDELRSFAVLDAYAEGGGNFIDTADVYANWEPVNQGGASETIIGNWLRDRGNRDQMVIATKVGAKTHPQYVVHPGSAADPWLVSEGSRLERSTRAKEVLL